MNIKLAIVVSHPIQHFCPQYASYAQLDNVKVKVFFASTIGMKPYKDMEFQQEVKWGNLYFNEFDHVFVNGESELPVDASIDSPNLEKELEDYEPNAVVIYGYFQKYQRRAYRWAVKRGLKIFYISDSELMHQKAFGLSVLKKQFLVNYFRKISAFLSVGDSNEDYYKYHKVSLKKMHRTSFPIDVKVYDAALAKRVQLVEKVRLKYNISSIDFVVSTVGKLISIKSQLDVINALIKLDQFQSRRIIYLVIGSGPDLEKLETLARRLKFHQVIFTGFTSPEDLPAFYMASSLYIQPSKTERHSLAVSEAIYSGCPILLSGNCGSYGPSDDVQAGFNGFVYDYGKVNMLAFYLKQVMINDSLQHLFSENSSSLGLKHQEQAHKQGLLSAINANLIA
jgi:glycosyltransferase involved in cell wall biosynthesis